MDAIRAFRREDIAQVASLWLRVFRQCAHGASTPLQQYFREIFFDSPWSDPGLPSLVYEEGSRGIVGFLGVVPRRMTFRGRPVRVAVATQLMVDERARTYPASKLMRRFLEGEQDLSFSDGANDQSEKLWCACGGSIALLHGLKWTRILRPAQYMRVQFKERAGSRGDAWLSELLRPACHALDTLAAWTGPGSRWLPGASRLLIEDEPDDQTLLWCVEHLAGERALQPDYSLDAFRWLLARAAEKKMYGALRRAVVREPNGDIAGWYLYYFRRGAVSEVLQFGARRKRGAEVLNCLFYEARARGAVAISGGFEPRFAKELTAGRCQFSWPGCAVVVQSRNREIMDAVHQGDAHLSRLEGEWWARFSDAGWAPDEPGPEKAVLGVTVPDSPG
jgi:hypothetical protein